MRRIHRVYHTRLILRGTVHGHSATAAHPHLYLSISHRCITPLITHTHHSRNKVEQRRTAGLLRPPPVPEEPGYAINMDFVFGLPRTERGHTGYLSMTCRLSNWLQVALCADQVSAEQSAQLVFDGW